MEVKDLGLGEVAAVSRSFRTLGEQPLRTYKQHSVDVNAVGSTGNRLIPQERLSQQTFFTLSLACRGKLGKYWYSNPLNRVMV